MSSTQAFITTPVSLTTTIQSFLTIFTHQVLYLRNIYPSTSFLSTRAYNFPVRQSRHPSVCQWINSAISAVGDQLIKGRVEEVGIVIFQVEGKESQVLERWRVDLSGLPDWGNQGVKGKGEWMFEREAGNAHGKTSPESFPIPEQNIQISTTDLEAHFRAILSRLNTTSSRLEPLVHRKPESLDQASDSSIANLELSFTISLTLKADADRPVSVLDREERKWIAAEAETETETETEPQASAQPDSESDSPSPNKADNDTKSEPNPKSKTKIKTTAIRKLEIGELRMQVFVEEGEAKFR